MLRMKACLNGARHPREHPALPVTPGELAQDAARVRAAGADALHLHVTAAARTRSTATPSRRSSRRCAMRCPGCPSA